MAITQDDMIAELQRTVAALQEKLDAALAQRSSEYGERIEHQAATLDVLKAMSASPGDPQPVFDLIARQAAKLCDVPTAAVATFDGTMVHLATQSGFDAAYADTYMSGFPRPVGPDFAMGRAILNRQVEQVEDITAYPGHSFADVLGHWSVMAVPMLRHDVPLGAITIGRSAIGPFVDTQVALLQTFAEQAVIAITSAETYRALQTRTSDLQEALEYQTATSDVLKVISRSTFDLQPVLDTVIETAARLCEADQAVFIRHENGIIEMVANFGFPPEYDAVLRKLGPHPLVVNAPMVAYRAITERRVVHIHDVAAVSGYAIEPIKLGQQRTSLGVPLLRAGEPIGSILLARRRVEPFTDRQIELVNTFADQAVIAIENTRLLTEQQEALEQQTATAEVLQVINANPGDLTPVFDAILDKAHTLCGAVIGSLVLFDGTYFRAVATHGWPDSIAALFREPTGPNRARQSLVDGERFVQVPDIRAIGRGPNSAWGDALVEGTDARTMLLVPLRKDGALLGFISAFRPEVRAFSDKEIALLENFAAQAVIAMENARLLDELRQRTGDLQESLEYQTATSDVLKVISQSGAELGVVLNTLVETAIRICDGVNAIIFRLRDDKRLYIVASYGVARGVPRTSLLPTRM